MSPHTYIFFGPSGSGKGTQARLLIEELKKRDSNKRILYLETGDKLREFAEEASLSAELTKDILARGELVPEFLPIWVWTEYLIRHVSGHEHIIIDGSPRKLEEAGILDSAIKFYKRERPTIVSIEVGPAWARERLLERGRSDDNEKEIKHRLEWYEVNVRPAIDFFKNNEYYRFLAINGERKIEEVHADILSQLKV